MIVVNTDFIPGMKIVKSLGLVKGNTIRARHIGKDILAVLKNIIGGEIEEYTKLLGESREQAIDRMVEEASQLGADAVINVRFATSMIMQLAAELLAYGTAVKVEGEHERDLHMNIVADENIPFAREAFSSLGDVTIVHGRRIPSLNNTDVLIIRSITKVGKELLDNSPVRFVGTATIGYDHIDLEYLKKRNIGFASAQGSNSNSVSEYVVAALLVYARDRGITLEGRSIGVIGVGNVGSKVVRKCEALGMRVLKNDPPLYDKTRDPSFLPLGDVITADFVTLHVPLAKDGNYPTYHMVNEEFVRSMNGVLINSSRGSVVDERALSSALGATVHAAVLDVWENEPNIDRDLALRVYGTPHIAGYSFNGKLNGTQMIYDAVCRFFGIEPSWKADEALPPGATITCTGSADEDVLRDAVLQVYDIERDFETFRQSMVDFDRLRNDYPLRGEFPTTNVLYEGNASAVRKLAGLGFRLAH